MRADTRLIIVTIIFFIFPWPGWAADGIPIFVSIAPQKYFVEQIGKDLVDVQVMVPAGADPHIFEPKPRKMMALSKARLYFAIGVQFEEAHLDKIVATHPDLKVVHTDQGIHKLSMAVHFDHEADHSHAKKDGHSKKGGLDPHIWLSPPLVKVQARFILEALQEMDPVHKADYQTNFKALIADIDQLDQRLKSLLADRRGLRFIVFHPSWGYFAHTYGLVQVPIEMEGKNLKPAQLKALIEHARGKGIRMVFVQPQFSTKSAAIVAREIGGQVAFADPLAADWMANLREVAAKLKAALR